MYKVLLHPAFEKWLNGLKDSMTRTRLSRRLDRASLGNLGDIKPIGDGVFEMREFFGPGWRMYYIHKEDTLILMLGGGNKSTQEKDIEKAIEISKNINGAP